MIGLDTNVLVRILADDDPVQTPLAARYLHERCSASSPGFVNCAVIVELSWVLQNAYEYTRSDIVDAMRRLLMNASLAIEARDQVSAALLRYESSNCDFVDALIGELNLLRGCEATVTFDRKAVRLPGFLSLK